jgi:hypothetical protein
MNGFQVLALGSLLVVLLLTLLAAVKSWVTRREALLVTIIAASAAAATAWPDEVTVPIAHKLGIGRGADLVFYCAVVVMVVGFWMTYIRLRLLRRQITLLVRQLAIQEAQRDPSNELRHSAPTHE